LTLTACLPYTPAAAPTATPSDAFAFLSSFFLFPFFSAAAFLSLPPAAAPPFLAAPASWPIALPVPECLHPSEHIYVNCNICSIRRRMSESLKEPLGPRRLQMHWDPGDGLHESLEKCLKNTRVVRGVAQRVAERVAERPQ